MYKLYSMPGSCSMAVHVVLNELNQAVTLEDVSSADGTRTHEYLKINSRGSVPTLTEGDFVLREGAAIIQYLCEKHNSNLLPASGQARAKALEWLMFCNATLHPAYSRCFFLMRNAEDPAKAKLLGTAVAMINKLWNDVEQQLSKTSYLCGDEITAADILLTVIANWSARMPDIKFGENTKKLFHKIIARPSYKKALEVEQVEYKVAA